MAKRVLVVDDDTALANTVCTILKSRGVQVAVAYDGISAQSLIALEDFCLIVSDIRMPSLSGIELLHFVKRTKQIPVILMTGFSEITQAKEAYELGAVGFLPKPFSRAALLELAEPYVSQTQGEVLPERVMDDDFSGLRVDEFVSGKEISFDLYIRMSEKKYIKVASGGESLDLARIGHYKEKGVTHLYLKKDDFRRYLGFTTGLAKKVVESKQIEGPRKLRFLAQTTMSLAKDLHVGEVEKEAFTMASELVVTTIEVAAESEETFNLIEMLRNYDNSIYRHSLAVSIYSVLVGKKVGWNSPRTLMRLGLCGLMHDVGKKELPKELLEKPRVQLSAAELKEMETHAKRGMEILSRISSIPEEVAMVAMQHHEDCKGLGFPLHLTKQKIQPLSRLVGLVNAFCEMVFSAPGYEGMKPQEALIRLASTNTGRYDEEFLLALCQIFKYEKVPNQEPIAG